MSEAIVILAGGKSLRMGEDKALLRIDGMTLLERIARMGLALGRDVLIVGRERPGDRSLDDVLFLPDEVPDAGPMGGLATALHHADCVMALACDLPLIDALAITWLWSMSERAFEDGLIVLNNGQIEPLFSIYKNACLPLIERRMSENRRSLRGLIEAGRFARIDAPPVIAARLVNVNTPDDFAAIQALTSRSEEIGSPLPASGGGEGEHGKEFRGCERTGDVKSPALGS